MRYITSTIAAVTLAGAVALAQEQAPAQPPAGAPPQAQQAPKATVTGCVAQAKTTDGGTAFVLTKAEGGSAKMYVLAESAQADWSKNVNKKVEVTGPVQEPTGGDKDSGAAANGNVVRPPAILAESMKVVAESCS